MFWAILLIFSDTLQKGNTCDIFEKNFEQMEKVMLHIFGSRSHSWVLVTDDITSDFRTSSNIAYQLNHNLRTGQFQLRDQDITYLLFYSA